MTQTSSPVPAKRMLSRNAIIAVAIIVILAVGVTSAVFLLRPPSAPSIVLWYNSTGHYGDTEPAVAQLIKSQIEASGKVTVNLQSEDWASYRADFAKGNLPFFLLGWYPDYFDTDDYVSPFYQTGGAQAEGSFYSNATVDQWVSNEISTVNSTLRGTYFQQIQNQSAKDVPYIPLWLTNAHIVYDSDITGVFLHPVVFKYFIMNKPGFDHITVGTTDSPSGALDPALAYDYFGEEIINQVFDTLLVYSPTNGTLLPGLATEVPSVTNGGISADGMTYTFNLRPNLKFSDNSPLNSTTVADSIKRVIRLHLDGSASFLLNATAALGNNPVIDTPSLTRVVFHLQQPVALFNQIMSFSVAAPVPYWYNQTGAQSDIVGGQVKVAGSGPYILTSITPNQQWVLQKNPNYYNPTLYANYGIPTIPILNQIIINRYSDSSGLKLAIQSHQINMAYRTLNPTDLSSLQTSAAALNLKVDIGKSPQIRFLVFNVKTAPFNDVKLRQAIAYLVDRDSIATNVFHGFAVPLYSMVPPGFFGPDYSQAVFQTVYGSSPNVSQAISLLSQVTLAISLSAFQTSTTEREWL